MAEFEPQEQEQDTEARMEALAQLAQQRDKVVLWLCATGVLEIITLEAYSIHDAVTGTVASAFAGYAVARTLNEMKKVLTVGNSVPPRQQG